MSSGTHRNFNSRKACDFEAAQIADLDRSLAALETEFRRDHFFYVENGLRVSERRFSVVRHGFEDSAGSRSIPSHLHTRIENALVRAAAIE